MIQVLIAFLLSFPLAFFAQFDSVVSMVQPFENMPGGSMLVAKGGKIVFEHQWGRANLKEGNKIDENTVFEIASISKQFVGAIALMLEEDGKLDLNQSIREYYPDLPEGYSKVKVIHLLTHTGGIRDYIDILGMRNELSEKNLFDSIMQGLHSFEPPGHEPGEAYAYSNSGYVFLAGILERASGKNLDVLLKEKIFDPLGMTNTRMLKKGERIIPGNTLSYGVNGRGAPYVSRNLKNTWGDAGIVSTPRDLFKWDQSFVNGQLGSQELIEKLRNPFFLNNGINSRYAMGVGVNYDRGKLQYRHTGNWDQFYSAYEYFSEDSVTIITMMNAPLPSLLGIHDLLKNEMLGVWIKPNVEDNECSGDLIEKICGIYLSKYVGADYREIVKRDSGLVYISRTESGEQSYLLYYQGFEGGKDVFIDSEGEKISFDVSGASVTYNWEHYSELYSKLDEAPMDPQLIEGDYKSKTLDLRIKAKVKKDRLVFGPLLMRRYKLDHITQNYFVVHSEDIIIRFEKDKMFISTPRSPNIQFDRLN